MSLNVNHMRLDYFTKIYCESVDVRFFKVNYILTQIE